MKKRACGTLAMLLVLVLVLTASALAEGETVTAQVPVEIVLEGQAPSPAENYTVQLTAVTEDAPMPAGTSGGVYKKTITGAASAVLEMDFSKTGVFSYTLKQLPGSSSSCTYDATEYSVTVFATVDGQWKLGLTVVITPDGVEKTDEAVFTNVYESVEPTPAKLDPPVQKKVNVKHGTAPADSVFTFAMIPGNADDPMPDNNEARRDAATGALYMDQQGPGSYEFGWMTFTQKNVGKTYVYTVKEVPGNESGYAYDLEIYTLKVKVTEKDGAVVLTVTYVNSDGEAVDKPVFTNVYDDRSDTPQKGPSTGDDSNVWFWAAAMGVSALVIATGVVLLSKKKKKDI